MLTAMEATTCMHGSTWDKSGCTSPAISLKKIEVARAIPAAGEELKRAIVSLATFASLALMAAGMCAAQSVIRPGEPWLDTHGQQFRRMEGASRSGKASTTGSAKIARRANVRRNAMSPAIRRAILHWKFRRQVLVTAGSRTPRPALGFGAAQSVCQHAYRQVRDVRAS